MIAEYEFFEEDWYCISKQAKDLIKKMLIKDPEFRISATDAFMHPWIQSNTYVERLDDKMFKKLSGFQAKN